jgi:predicted dehydrogenase
VFHNRRWDGDFLTVRRLVSEGALGQVTRFESRFERFRPQIKQGAWRELGDAAEGGGLLLDLGPHLVDQAVQLFGPPLSVYAEVETRRPGAQVDDDVFVALEHAGGERSHLWMSAIAPLHGPRFRVSGLQAGFGCDGLDPQEDQLRTGKRPGDPGWGEAPPGWVAGEDRTPVELERGRYEDYYAQVRDWVQGDAPPPVDPADGVRVLEILEQARAVAGRA